MLRAGVPGAVGNWEPPPGRGGGLVLSLEGRLRTCVSAQLFLMLLVAEDTFQTFVQA